MVMFSISSLESPEIGVLESVEVAQQRLAETRQNGGDWMPLLRRAALARHLKASNAIEGHHVTLDDGLAAVEGRPPMEASDSDWKTVTGYWDALSYILQLGQDPEFSYNGTVLRAVHFIMFKHARDSMPGLYRSGGVSVGSGGPEDVVFEDVPHLVDDLLGELDEDPAGDVAVVRAALAHLNVVAIRPFKGGNGCMARTLQTLVLAREAEGSPEFWSIEEYLGEHASEYFKVLAEVGKERDARPWVRFVLLAHYRQSLTWIGRIREAERLWEAVDTLRGREGLDARETSSLFRAAMGLRVRRPDHIAATGVSERVASSDLKKLVDAGLLRSVGDRRGRYYVAGQKLKRVRGSVQEKPSELTDPFS